VLDCTQLEIQKKSFCFFEFVLFICLSKKNIYPCNILFTGSKRHFIF